MGGEKEMTAVKGSIDFMEAFMKRINAPLEKCSGTNEVLNEEKCQIEQKINVNEEQVMFENENGTLLRVSVSDACSGCGACSTVGDCFVDGVNGKAVPAKGGCFSKQELPFIEEAEDLCPENAISHTFGSVVKSSGSVSTSDIKTYIEKNFLNYKYPRPQYKDYEWGYNSADVDGEGFYGWSDYEYSSYESAKSAGLRELRRVIFEHLDAYISQALLEYKHKTLRPLVTYEECDSNFYYKEKCRVMLLIGALLEEIESVTGSSISNKEQYISVKLIPEFGYKGKNFEAFTQIEEHTGMLKGEIEGSSEYEAWIDEDDRDEYKGESWLGGSKYVTKWAFRVHDAVREIEKDMNRGAKSEMPEYFRRNIDSNYQFGNLVEPMEEEIKKLGKSLIELLG